VNIRSITAFVDAAYPLDSAVTARAGDAIKSLREALTAAGITVQTARLATQPFPAVLGASGPDKALDLAKDLQAIAFVHEIDYLALGPVRLSDSAAYLEAVVRILAETDNVFASVEIATLEHGIDLARVRRTAGLVRRVSALSDDGFANLRLAALANVPPWSPFFPAAYHGGGGVRIAFAMECADLAVKATSEATSLEDARARLIQSIEREAERIAAIVAKTLARGGNAEFIGFDFSLAPFPEEARSIGTALERLGLSAAGIHGTLMAAAFLTDSLDRANFQRTGFNGLMLPVLEDSILARRAAEGILTVTELLTYSAVCGTGLDTIALPGDISEDALAGILLDTAALALRLNKPLTARLMPLPGKQAGDPAEFDFEFFANSRVIAPQGGVLGGLLAGDERVQIRVKGP
jgi:uncharacterized protein